MVPVSIRSGGEDETYQNRVSGLLANLATDEKDPIERLHEDPGVDELGQGRCTPRSRPRRCRTTRCSRRRRSPPGRCGCTAAPSIADRMNPPFNLIISNVPGPELPALLGGRAAAALLPRVVDRRRPGPEHDRAELQRQSRLRVHLLTATSCPTSGTSPATCTTRCRSSWTSRSVAALRFASIGSWSLRSTIRACARRPPTAVALGIAPGSSRAY